MRENIERDSGSTRRGTATLTGCTSTIIARCGRTATGWSTRSTRTCLSMNSSSSRLPETCCPQRRSNSKSPPASIAATLRRPRAERFRPNLKSTTWSIATIDISRAVRESGSTPKFFAIRRLPSAACWFDDWAARPLNRISRPGSGKWSRSRGVTRESSRKILAKPVIAAAFTHSGNERHHRRRWPPSTRPLANSAPSAESSNVAGGPVGGGALGQGHFPAKAKRVIWLFMAGVPSHLDTLDHKPQLDKWFDTDLPESVRKGQRLTTMTASQSRFPIAPTMFRFDRNSECGKPVSELLPKTGSMADDLAFIHTVHTEAINHDPAITFIQTGNQIPGKPTLGSWISYGLGTLNRNMPEFIVLNCEPRGQALYSRLWGAAFSPRSTPASRFGRPAIPSSTCRTRMASAAPLGE